MLLLNWRSRADYADLEQMERSDLAWEFLRRNSAYRRSHEIAFGNTGSHGDWKSPDAYKWVNELNGLDLAWQFARRNKTVFIETEISQLYESYYEKYEKIFAYLGQKDGGFWHKWGLRFPSNPNLTANQTPVFWRPIELSSAVILEGASLAEKRLSQLETKGKFEIVRRKAEDGTHLLIRKDKSLHQIFITHPIKEEISLTSHIPFDKHMQFRFDALSRCWAILNGETLSLYKTDDIRRNRLIENIRIFDGRSARASYRDIADALFNTTDIKPDDWKDSAQRTKVIVRVKAANRLIDGEYRLLLRSWKAI